jgi:hypothetical protein
MNNSQDRQFQMNFLFIPIKYIVADRIDHVRTFWGIRFPVIPLSFYQSPVYIIHEYLESSGHPVLHAHLQRLDLALVLPAVVVEADWKFIEHKVGFPILIK